MKTAHQFARELLDGPDLPIVVSPSDPDAEAFLEPALRTIEAEEDTGEIAEVVLVTGLPREES